MSIASACSPMFRSSILRIGAHLPLKVFVTSVYRKTPYRLHALAQRLEAIESFGQLDDGT
jgi:hypothetical protein